MQFFLAQLPSPMTIYSIQSKLQQLNCEPVVLYMFPQQQICSSKGPSNNVYIRFSFHSGFVLGDFPLAVVPLCFFVLRGFCLNGGLSLCEMSLVLVVLFIVLPGFSTFLCCVSCSPKLCLLMEQFKHVGRGEFQLCLKLLCFSSVLNQLACTLAIVSWGVDLNTCRLIYSICCLSIYATFPFFLPV